MSASARNRRRLTIDLELDGQAIAGELAVEAGPPTPFSGWLGLTEALEEALRGPVTPPSALTEVE